MDQRGSQPEPILPLPRAIRALLPEVVPTEPDTNLGLWLDRYIRRTPGDWTLKADQRQAELRRFAGAWTSAAGAQALLRRVAGCQVLGASEAPDPQRDWLVRFRAPLLGPLLVDYGRFTATELSLSFHPIWGVPRVPGSALKGLARAQATLEGWEDPRLALAFGRGPVEGDQGSGGLVDFYDAAPELGRFSLAVDVLTPHNREWYDDPSKDGPVEWKSPVPFTFLTVVRTTFVFDVGMASGGPRRQLRPEQAAELLQESAALLSRALSEQGVGAKTAAGYGFFDEPTP